MLRKLVLCLLLFVPAVAGEGSRTFPAAGREKLILDLDAGAEVRITGTGGSSVVVAYTAVCTPECEVSFDETRNAVKVISRFVAHRNTQNSNVDLDIRVPRRFDVEVASSGGSLTIDGVEGELTGQTAGGELKLQDVHGRAALKTMGGDITLTDSELDGSLSTMGGEVRFKNVVGDVKGSSMGGNVRLENVQRRSAGGAGSDSKTVQISTMGGEIEVDTAPAGAELETHGGAIHVRDASRFVRATTMGGDIAIDAVDGAVDATTMGGDVAVTVVGKGGDVQISSMGGDIVLQVPAGFGMDLDLEIAYTRNSRQGFHIEAPGEQRSTATDDWDHEHGSPRKYIRQSGAVHGGGNRVKVRTINGDITVREGSK